MFVTVKLATTLDGRIATHTGESKWITGPEARRVVHELRAQHDAVLVGVNTVLADDPRLDARDVDLPRGKQPDRIVLDSKLRSSPEAQVYRNSAERIFLLSAVLADEVTLQKFGDHVNFVQTSKTQDGRVDIVSAMERIENEYDVSSVFVEGGGQVAASFLRAGLVDRLEWFRAPKLIGADGIPALGNLNVHALSDALRFRLCDVRSVGQDIWETYERK